MEWIRSTMQWATTVLEQTGVGPGALPVAFLLGLLSAIACTCCTLPVLGAVAGYSGTKADKSRRSNLVAALFFMMGAVIATVILGAVAGFVGQVAQSTLGTYWKLFAGIIAIFVGLAALKLLPFKLPGLNMSGGGSEPKGLLGVAVFGLVVGGGIGACSLPCNPGILIVLGVAVLEGYTFWMVATLTAYAVIRTIAGVLLLFAGFYFLATF
ncbi:MAG: cytochrome c biogenesis CcdA family protein [Planctomycetota bacterium]